MRPLLAALAASALLASPTHADPVDDLVRGYMEAGHVPGAAVAVVESGRITKLQGYGAANLEWGGPATADTPFQTASASKIFAGVVLMRLVEQGKVGLDDPISRWFEGAPESWSRIRVRHLAGHMSGLPDGLGLPPSATVHEVAAEAMKRPLAYEPGSQSRYGLTDFIVMTAILEKAGGATYPELVRREIVEPLGLTHTGFTMTTQEGPVRSSSLMPGRSAVYAWRDTAQREETYLYPVHAYAAGGLYSSARDFATLMAALESGALLKPRSVTLLTTPARLDDGREGDFGVGWTFRRRGGVEMAGHSGGPALADVLYAPSHDLTVIVLTNQRLFYPIVAQSIVDLKLPAPKAETPIRDASPALTATLRAFLGEAAAGKVDDARFAEKGAGAAGYYRQWGVAMLRTVGAVRSLDLMAERRLESGQLRRRYRIGFERGVIDFVVRTEPDGRFVEVQPLSGDDRPLN